MGKSSKCAAAIGLVLAMPVASIVKADEFAITLKPGPGSEQAQSYCSACHSLDYVIMNSPFPTAKVWEGIVNKMIKIYGAEIPPDDAKAIIDYLSKTYGN